jgi:hypothetical protein
MTSVEAVSTPTAQASTGTSLPGARASHAGSAMRRARVSTERNSMRLSVVPAYRLSGRSDGEQRGEDFRSA